MIYRIKYLLFYIFLFNSICLTQTLDKIEISGNKVFSVSEILNWSGLRKGLPVNNSLLDTVIIRIFQNLATLGYHHPDFSGSSLELKEDSSGADISVVVSEGFPSIVKRINIAFSDSISDESIVKPMGFLEGQIFNKAQIENQLNNLLNKYEDIGFPFVRVIIQSVSIYPDSAEDRFFCDLNIRIDKGIESRIDKIKVTGNNSTLDYVILREMRLPPRQIYSQKIIDELPRRLNRLRFFEPVAPPQYYINSDGEGVLVVNVKERQTNNFDGIIGYIPPRSEDEKGYLTGLVNISLRNLFGTGRAAAFRWQQFDRNSQELELKYLEPWLLGYPFNINLSLYQRKQDTTYVQRKIEGALEYLATEDISASVFIASESVIPSERTIPVLTVFNSSVLTTGVSFRIDTRDDPFAPAGGLLFNTAYSFSRKKINGPVQFLSPSVKIDINYQRITFSLNLFYEIFNRQVIALGLNGRELRGSDFENSDLFRLGGTMSLRGYREDQFLGNRVFWSNLEFRSLLTQRSYAFLFFDTGYYLRNEDSDRLVNRQEEFRVGYGLGLSLETGLGILAVSFALGQGDSFSDGKIHFGIVNEF